MFHELFVIDIRLNSLSFQTFFAAFKIVVDIWEISMLLSYIVWDD